MMKLRESRPSILRHLGKSDVPLLIRAARKVGLFNGCQRHGWDISRETLAKIESRIRWVADFELVQPAKVLQVSEQDLIHPPASVSPNCVLEKAVIEVQSAKKS